MTTKTLIAPESVELSVTLPIRPELGTEVRVLRDCIQKSFWYRRRSIITVISLVSGLAMALLSPSTVREGTLLAIAINGLGWISLLAGVTLRLWATLYIGGRKGIGVMDRGPYSICRNPLYWGTLFALIGGVLMVKSAILALTLILPIFIYVKWVVPAEEAYLTEKLGLDYVRYCNRVPRWWPQWNQYSGDKQLEVKLAALWSETCRVVGWLSIPFGIQLLLLLKAQQFWNTPLNFL